MRFLTDALEAWRNLDNQLRLRAGYVLIALLTIIMAWSFLAGKTAELERKRTAREAVLKEMLPLKVAYNSAKTSSNRLQERLAMVGADDSPAKIIEEIGIKGKGVRITPVKGEERSGFIEDAADVKIDGLTANEAVNLLYRLEKGSRPLVVKKANLRVRFEDPSRFDLVLVVALLKPVPGVPR